MNQKSIALTAVLTAALFTGISTTTPLAVYASSEGDESETNTEQRLKQKNVGSGESTNFNCGENSIDGGFIDAQLCGTVGEDGGDGGGDGGSSAFCHDPEGGPAQTLNIPRQAQAAHLAAQAAGVPGHEGDHVGACAAG